MNLPAIHTSSRTIRQDLLKSWLATVPADTTRLNYFYKIRKFLQTSGLDPFKITSFELEAYIRKAIHNRASQGTVRGQMVALASFYRYLCKKDPDIPNPVRSLAISLVEPKEGRAILTRKRALSENQIERMLHRFREAENGGKEISGSFLFKFLLNTGMRISEAISLEHFDPKKSKQLGDKYINYLRIDKNEQGRAIEGYVYVLGKGRRPREFFLNRQFSAYILTRGIPPGECLLQNRFGKRLTPNGALWLMKHLAKKYLTGETYKFSPHALRHTLIFLKKWDSWLSRAALFRV